MVGLIVCKYYDGNWNWTEADFLNVPVVFLPSQEVSSDIVAGAGLMLTVLVCLWHPCLDRRQVLLWLLELE
jgi:hypothetical protein